jgi:hypothetical protein
MTDLDVKLANLSESENRLPKKKFIRGQKVISVLYFLSLNMGTQIFALIA